MLGQETPSFEETYESFPFRLYASKHYYNGEKDASKHIIKLVYTDRAGVVYFVEDAVITATITAYRAYFKELKIRLAQAYLNNNGMAYITGYAEQELVDCIGQALGETP